MNTSGQTTNQFYILFFFNGLDLSVSLVKSYSSIFILPSKFPSVAPTNSPVSVNEPIYIYIKVFFVSRKKPGGNGYFIFGIIKKKTLASNFSVDYK